MSAPTSAAVLLVGLTGEQQRLVDLIADAFIDESYEWPYYDYVERVLDDEGHDAWTVIQSFPQVGRWGYSSVSWMHAGQGVKPNPETEIALTLAGMSHAEALASCVEVSFVLLDFMASERRRVRPMPREVAETAVTSHGFREFWTSTGRVDLPHPRMVYQLLEREPVGSFGSRGYDVQTGEWSRAVSREHRGFAGLSSIDAYIELLAPWLTDFYTDTPSFSAPPVRLPTAIDHLDDVWRLVSGRWLFNLRGAERIGSLDAGVDSRDEFLARLSALGDLFRTASKGLEGSVEAGKARDRPLAHLFVAMSERVDEDSREMVADAVRTLEAVIALRDSRQHSGASHRSHGASTVLGLPYPIVDWAGAWQTVQSQTVSALGTIRDELRATID